MAFDFYGFAARSRAGEVFRCGLALWHPLADYVLSRVTVPENDYAQWHGNFGYVISAQTAAMIAEELNALIASGDTLQYARDRMERWRAVPDEPCDVCEGTGRRTPFDCFACNAKGTRRPWSAHHAFTVQNVARFAAFCRDSGGFEIA